ncbi:transposase [Nitrosococcus wardiae]|uniref:Tc1-like transposase DDE domain-containing protein n=1 Tax=Nitrosococcus wardiae TaxID=1814290 RepID=A0A4P7C0E7_9GAMM|nr:hypothetical protein [Nitrosococcus wardiae]QBQ54196.1 hypothetical protein E3U44_06525 [Nitrosococcus wardiae]
MAQDEGRFGRIDRPRRGWAPQPVRPHVPCQVIREFVYVFAAVCAPLGRLTALLLPTANTERMALFLAQVAQEFSEYFIIMLVDRAGWHTTPRLSVPENIHLVPQPARSPDSTRSSIFGKSYERKRWLTPPSPRLKIWKIHSAPASISSPMNPIASAPSLTSLI